MTKRNDEYYVECVACRRLFWRTTDQEYVELCDKCSDSMTALMWSAVAALTVLAVAAAVWCLRP